LTAGKVRPVTDHSTPDIQYFAKSGVWVKPPAAVRVDVFLYGAGGGAGQIMGVGPVGLTRRDGQSGEMLCNSFDASQLPEQVDVHVGKGGRGGGSSASFVLPFGTGGWQSASGGDGADGYALILTHMTEAKPSITVDGITYTIGYNAPMR
jgi:hypothetical protein